MAQNYNRSSLPEGSEEDGQQSLDECTRNVCQYAEICVSVEIKPRTVIGRIQAECCGEPEICCKDYARCNNRGCNGHEIIVTQKVQLRIPIRYEADVCNGAEKVVCKDTRP